MSASLDRSWKLLFALQGHVIDGVLLTELAQAVGQSAPTTLRDLEALAANGIVARIPGMDKRWHLTPRLVQVAVAHQAEIGRAEQRLEDIVNRYSRTNQ